MHREKKGMLIVQAESQSNTRDQLCVTFQGEKLANKDGFFGKSDPFIVASRCSTLFVDASLFIYLFIYLLFIY